MSKHPIPCFPIDEPFDLPEQGNWPKTRHVFEKADAYALRAAMAAQRPLLVRGEPGTGKSQLARAAAVTLGRVFIPEVVHARSESQDLQWQFDAVARLGEAQALGAGHCSRREIDARLDPLAYLSPGPLWWAFDWEAAEAQYRHSRFKQRHPVKPEDWTPATGSVVLIDEIDKADADLPNGLLETLGTGGFTVPYRDRQVSLPDGVAAPLVIITTNEERELPAAFVRRCFVLHLHLPDDDPRLQDEDESVRRRKLLNWLVKRGKDHFGRRVTVEVARLAAMQLWEDRKAARGQGVSAPGQAEYLDLLRALDELEPGEPDKQQQLLMEIKDFALKKYGS